jgi:hypothetical protein
MLRRPEHSRNEVVAPKEEEESNSYTYSSISCNFSCVQFADHQGLLHDAYQEKIGTGCKFGTNC